MLIRAAGADISDTPGNTNNALFFKKMGHLKGHKILSPVQMFVRCE